MSERLHELWLRVKALWRSRQLDRDLEDEVAFHLAMREQALRQDGMADRDARQQARRQFGNSVSVSESLRELWRFGVLDRLWQDMRFGARLARRQPSFTMVVVATLALGIGASTAMFTIVDAVMLRPYALPGSDRLVVAWETNLERDIDRFSGSVANYVDWQRSAATFAELGAFENRTDNRTDGAQAEQINGGVASSAFFRALGIQPAAGRFFLRGEDDPARRFVAVLGHEYWRRAMGGDAAAIGRAIVVNGEPHEIVGIMPPMRAPFVADVWRPLAPDVAQLDRGDHNVVVVGRLAPGYALSAAEAELQTIAARLAASYPVTNTGWSVRLEPLYDAVVPPATRGTMIMLMAAVAMLLLVACVNVANLMLARGTRRQREVSTRLALGASRGRIAAQLLAEAGVMSILGGVAGLLVAVWTLRLVEWVFPAALESIARLAGSGLPLHGYAFGFTAAIALLTTFVVGVVPALRLSREPFEGGVLATARTTTEAPRAGRLRSGLVIAQIALALVLLVGAGLLIRSVDLLQREPLGFSADGVVTAKVGLYSARYQTSLAAYAAFIDGLVEGLERQPGVLAAGVSSSVPFGGGYTVMQVRLDNAGSEPANGVQAQWRVIGGNYLPAMGIPLKAGRMFNASDDRERPVRVTIINEALAERLWPGQNPIGRHMLVSDARRSYEVIGVTPSSRMTLLGRELEPAMYFHYLQFRWLSMTVAVRTAGSPPRLDAAIREVVATLDREQPVADVRVLSDLVADAASSPRMTASLVSIFAALALILAAIGVYGLMSYSAAQRTGEIGIRLALGARPIAMFRLIWMQGLRHGVLGLLIGVVGAAVSSRALGLFLYQVSPIDPLTYGTVFGIMTAVTFAACYVPARRAMRIDPSSVLRHE